MIYQYTNMYCGMILEHSCCTLPLKMIGLDTADIQECKLDSVYHLQIL